MTVRKSNLTRPLFGRSNFDVCPHGIFNVYDETTMGLQGLTSHLALDGRDTFEVLRRQ